MTDMDLHPGSIGPCGPLVDPFPWTAVTRVERDLTEHMRERMLERFLIAEDYIRLRDNLRERAQLGLHVAETVGVTQWLQALEHRFDELAPDATFARLRAEARLLGVTVEFPEWVSA